MDAVDELPGVVEDGMSGKNAQQKHGTTRGSPRRSRTAKALRISRRAVESRCARERDGWGRLSDDGPGHYNPDPSEGPWGRRSTPPHGGAQSSPQARLRAVPSMWATKCTKDGRKLDDDQRAFLYVAQLKPAPGIRWSSSSLRPSFVHFVAHINGTALSRACGLDCAPP